MQATASEYARSARPQPKTEAGGIDCRVGPTDLTIIQPGGSRSLRPATVMKLGANFLIAQHRGYIHLGSACQVVVPTLESREQVMLAGHVTACEHVAGNTHETHLTLDSWIDPGHYLHLPDNYVQADPTGDAAGVNGDVLVIEPNEAVRRVLRHQLRGTRVETTLHAELPSKQLGQAGSFDAALVRVDDAGSDADRVLGALRAMGVTGPVIALRTAGPDDGQRLVARGFADVLDAPFGRGELLATLERVLRSAEQTPTGPVHSDLPRDANTAELVDWYLEQVQLVAGGIRKAMKWADVDEVHHHCRMLAETASSYGFAGVTRQARRALSRLDTTHSIPQATDELEGLVQLCSRLA